MGAHGDGEYNQLSRLLASRLGPLSPREHAQHLSPNISAAVPGDAQNVRDSGTSGVDAALSALLRSRGDLASKMKGLSEEPNRGPVSKGAPLQVRTRTEQALCGENDGRADVVSVASSIPESRFSRDSRVRLKGLDGLLAGVAQALGLGRAVASEIDDAEQMSEAGSSQTNASALPDVTGVTDVKLSKKAKQRILRACRNTILKERPWLATTGAMMSPAEAAAASHLLLYAEGLQQYRLANTGCSVGQEVVLAVDHRLNLIPDTTIRGGTTGVLIDVDLQLGTCVVNIDGVGEVSGIPISIVAPLCRKVLPIEAVLRYDELTRNNPTAARAPCAAMEMATSPAIPDGGTADAADDRVPVRLPSVALNASIAPDLQDVLLPLLNALGGVDPLIDHLSLYDSEADSEDTDTASKTMQSPVGAGKAITAARHNELTAMIGTHVCVIRDLREIARLCDMCFDSNVDVFSVLHFAGQIGRVIAANVGAETVRVAFQAPTSRVVWLPMEVLTRCTSDPLLSMGGGKTTVTVLGNPTRRDIKKAAEAIVAHEMKRQAKTRGPNRK